MGFLQDAKAIARRNPAAAVPLPQLEQLRDKYNMDAETFKPLRRKSKRGLVAFSDIKQYFYEFSQPFFTATRSRRRGSG